jgi:hypothetical protein
LTNPSPGSHNVFHPPKRKKEVIGIAPLSKIIVGSGGHDSPGTPWLAAKTVKLALAEALGDEVRLGLLTFKQAEEAARMYGLEEY